MIWLEVVIIYYFGIPSDQKKNFIGCKKKHDLELRMLCEFHEHDFAKSLSHLLSTLWSWVRWEYWIWKKMPKVKQPVEMRLRNLIDEFGSNISYIGKDGCLMCKSSDTKLKHSRKSNITSHLKTAKHLKNHAANVEDS